MSKNITTASSGGISFLGLLTILFIGLKLTGYITWSWWFVLMPIYIVPTVLLGAAGIAFLLYLLAVFFESLSIFFKGSKK